jgi:Helix-turn-helix domain
MRLISPKSSSVTPRALKLKQVANYLGGIYKTSVCRLIKRGRIKCNRALRHVIISVAELDRFLVGGQR